MYQENYILVSDRITQIYPVNAVTLLKQKNRTSVNKVITKLPNSEQSSKGKVKTHKYINKQNQSTTGKL